MHKRIQIKWFILYIPCKLSLCLDFIFALRKLEPLDYNVTFCHNAYRILYFRLFMDQIIKKCIFLYIRVSGGRQTRIFFSYSMTLTCSNLPQNVGFDSEASISSALGCLSSRHHMANNHISISRSLLVNIGSDELWFILKLFTLQLNPNWVSVKK